MIPNMIQTEMQQPHCKRRPDIHRIHMITAFRGPIILSGVFLLHPGVLQVEAFTRALHEAIILNPACQTKLRLIPDFLHAHRQGVASQIDDFVGVLQTVRRHRDIALDSFTRFDRLIHQAIETIPADISRLRSQWVYGAVAAQVQSPME